MKPKKPTAKTAAKPKPVKAKRYYKTENGTLLYPTLKQAQYFSGFNAPNVAPVAVLPCDKASVDAMVEQVAVGISSNKWVVWDDVTEEVKIGFRLRARAALAAIGIKGGAK